MKTILNDRDNFKVTITNKTTGETETWHVDGDRLNIRKNLEVTEDTMPEVIVEMLNPREGRKHENRSV